MSNWVYLATDWPRQKRQSSVGGFQNQPRNWPPVPSGAGAGQTAVLGPKLGSGTAGKTVTVLGGWPQNQL